MMRKPLFYPSTKKPSTNKQIASRLDQNSSQGNLKQKPIVTSTIMTSKKVEAEGSNIIDKGHLIAKKISMQSKKN